MAYIIAFIMKKLYCQDAKSGSKTLFKDSFLASSLSFFSKRNLSTVLGLSQFTMLVLHWHSLSCLFIFRDSPFSKVINSDLLLNFISLLLSSSKISSSSLCCQSSSFFVSIIFSNSLIFSSFYLRLFSAKCSFYAIYFFCLSKSKFFTIEVSEISSIFFDISFLM